MKNFKEIMTTSDVKYTINNMVGSGTIVFDADFILDNNTNNVYSVTVAKVWIDIKEKSIESYELSFYLNSKMIITGTGNAFRVFSAVIKIFKDEFLNKEFPDYFHFFTNELSRQKFYQHFSENIEKYIPTYQFKGVFEIGGAITYLFKAK